MYMSELENKARAVISSQRPELKHYSLIYEFNQLFHIYQNTELIGTVSVSLNTVRIY